MLSPKISRWLSALIMLLLALRLLGHRFYRSQQPENEAQLANIKARVQVLADSIEAAQDTEEARDTTTVMTDSTIRAADTAATANQ